MDAKLFSWRRIIGGLLCILIILSLAHFAMTKNFVAASPLQIALVDAAAETNSNPDQPVSVRLGITNTIARSLLVTPRAVVYEDADGWRTNYSNIPFFIGLSGSGSVASSLTLNRGQGVTVKLSPVKSSTSFRIEFLCFPERAGIRGGIDRARSIYERLREGIVGESFLGKSVVVATPVIHSMLPRQNQQKEVTHKPGAE